MPSLIEGYEYDVFISYRQKDNKYDGWVTEFVANLKKELDATFKEDISIYFDENSHDGLLETNLVSESLEGKLKCLVFIPVISQTYCDPKSFAWNNEFLAFKKRAAEDSFGLKIKLPNGNVVGRILPVRIHDLDAKDKSLLEEITGHLRSIDFIFKVAGVNRPLRAKDDDIKGSTNSIYYRDQINKVANAVKAIIAGLAFSPDDPNNKLPAPESLQETEPQVIESDSKLTNRSHSTGIWLAWLFGFLTIVFGSLSVWVWQKQNTRTIIQPATHSSILLKSPIIDRSGQYPYFVISPDGRTIAYPSTMGITLKSLSDFSSKLLEGTEGAVQLSFSPDGRLISFLMAGMIQKISIDGSSRSPIIKTFQTSGYSWGIDGNIYYSIGLGSGGIWRVSANGGDAEQITFVNDSLGETAHTLPQLLPDSKTLLFTILGPSGGQVDSRIAVQRLGSRERKVIVEKAIAGRLLPNGDLAYVHNDGTVFTRPFDLDYLDFKGEPTAVLSDVTTSTWGGVAFISVAQNGNIIYLPRTDGTLNSLEITDRLGHQIQGDSIPMTMLLRLGRGWGGLRVSPKGDLGATTGRSYGTSDIWIIDFKTKNAERVTFDAVEEEFPVWSNDGNLIAYTAAQTGNSRLLLIKDLRNSSNPRLIGKWPKHIHFSSWSPDGKWLAAVEYSPTGGLNIVITNADNGESKSYGSNDSNENQAEFSPNGRWLAFQSDESGTAEIYVISFPAMENKKQISVGGGGLPRWDKSGKFIYYRRGGNMFRQPVETGSEFKSGEPEKMFKTESGGGFDISPDGQKFYLIIDNIGDGPPLRLVTNWFEEVEKKKNRQKP